MNGQFDEIAERILRLLLRCTGSAALLALVAVFMPAASMESTNQWLGLGPLPAGPIVGYLTRSLSLFYALLGGLLWVCSFHLHRYRPVLRYLGAAFICFGIVVWGVDIVEGMPGYWKYTEGPMVITLGLAILGLLGILKPRTLSEARSRANAAMPDI